jgi:hypothetical protein
MPSTVDIAQHDRAKPRRGGLDDRVAFWEGDGVPLERALGVHDHQGDRGADGKLGDDADQGVLEEGRIAAQEAPAVP